MDRDATDHPSEASHEGSEWSVEDFDDFTAFDDLELDAADATQPSFDFDDAAQDADQSAPVGGRSDDAVSPPPGDEEPPSDVVDSVSQGADVAAAMEQTAEVEHAEAIPNVVAAEPPMSDAFLEPEDESPSAFEFEPLNEPEASMARPASRRLDTSDALDDESAEAGDEPQEADVFDYEDVPDFSDFTQEQYVKATTQEYAGLAEEVARAAEQDSEQIAVAAGIPGIESGIVGLEDVVGDATDTDVPIPARSGSDLSVRVLTGIALVAIFFGSLTQDYLIATLIFVVMFISAVELYVVLIRQGHRPMTLFGLIGVGITLFGSFYWGPKTIPIVVGLTAVATLVFFGVVAHRRAPLLDAALTILVVAWIGGLGSLAMDIAFQVEFAWMIAAVVATTALMDVAQYFVGRRMGKRALAPRISPKKTVEGLIGGVVVALGVGIGFGFLGPFDLIDGVIIGVIVAVVAPLGDLAVSVFKRALGVKDMSAVLPGHGGVLDRIDAMVFVIPAMWVAYSWMGLIA